MLTCFPSLTLPTLIPSLFAFFSFSILEIQAFEMADIIVLFMAISFCFQAAFLVAFASHYGKVYVTAMRTTLEALIVSYNDMKTSAWTWRRFHSQSSYMPFAPSLRRSVVMSFPFSMVFSYLYPSLNSIIYPVT